MKAPKEKIFIIGGAEYKDDSKDLPMIDEKKYIPRKNRKKSLVSL